MSFTGFIPNNDDDLDTKLPFLHPHPYQNGKRKLNWKWISTWLENAPHVPPLHPIPHGFRLIDIEKKSVVRAPVSGSFKYACLSYVWGTITTFQATSKTISQLEKSGSLSDCKVPTTIQDAMTVCRYLGLRYLWVDRLCILQDDNDLNGEKQAQLNDMGRIYNHAVVTLAAMEGDASFGLHGVSTALAPRLNPTSFIWEIPQRIAASRWAQRGWTFQEAMLSRRLMIFTPAGIFVEHDHDPPEIPAMSKEFEGCFNPLYHGPIPFHRAVAIYTARELGYESDILSAFHGVCSHFYDNNHKFGIPLVGFHEATHWLSLNNTRRRRYSQGQNVFPSWSWISVKGQITLRTTSDSFHVASWVFLSKANGKTSMVLPRPRHLMLGSSDDGGFMPGKAVRRLAARALQFDFLLEKPEFPEGRSFFKMWPSTTDLWKTLQGLDRSNQPSFLVEIPSGQPQLATSPGRVILFSQSTRFSITPLDGNKGPGEGPAFCYVHAGNRKVGIVVFDDKKYEEEIQAKAESPQFVALSISPGASFWCGEFGSFKKEFYNVLPKDGWHVSDFVWAMAVKTRDDGVSQRIGFGWIIFDEWVKLKPKKTSFVLE